MLSIKTQKICSFNNEDYSHVFNKQALNLLSLVILCIWPFLGL